MEKLSVKLQNCYGIKKLAHTFDFSGHAAYAIYAPNGSMKSSFAATFKDIATGKKPIDRIFPTRQTICEVKDEKGGDLPPNSILVLEPYDEFFSHSEKTCTLLVNNKLRKEFEQLNAALDKSKEDFLTTMKAQSGSKKDLGREIAIAFTMSDKGDSFYQALARIKDELEDQKDAPFADVSYDVIFDDKVLAALGTADVQKALKDYIKRYNELLENSTYFRKGVFEYYNASQVAKILADNGFFNANHTVTLNAGEKKEIFTQKELEEVVAEELAAITADKELKARFGAIKKTLEKNATLRDFQAYVCAHETLLAELENVPLFKQKLWKSYFKKHEDKYRDVLAHYQKVKERRKEIEEEAAKERTQWESAIELFNERFFVPFVLEVKNKVNVLLGSESILDLGYRFKDGADEAPVDRDALMKALSTGEKKALYILNIIFEIEVRRQTGTPTLFVVDDIADSFDYKNKYAIVQYLQEISEQTTFRQIILTHNFDFFRTIEGRIVRYADCLMATKSPTEVTLHPAEGIRNIFVKVWKREFFSDGKKRIASIPFMRNLIEYTHGDNDANYLKLTSLLHWKAGSDAITQKELDAVYHTLFGGTGNYANPTEGVTVLLKREADSCIVANDGVNFENKVVLSIATRFFADKYMAQKIADPAFVAQIDKNQTRKLFEKFQTLQNIAPATIKTLRSVCLMTPENLHLNAFMYEPILDMSDGHLRRLYSDVIALP